MDKTNNISEDDIIKITINSIERNIRGLKFSVREFKTIFKNIIPNSY